MQVSHFARFAAIAFSAGMVFATTPLAADAYHSRWHHRRHYGNNIVQKAIAEGNLKTFVHALRVAGLVGTLDSGTYTVFAPTDAAFAKLPKSQLNALLADKKTLRWVLLYHVVPGRQPADTLTALRAVKTVGGEHVIVNVKDGAVEVDGSLVTKADIKARNGIIHEVDEVLMPGMATR